jgi:hypothetical protein
MRFSRELDIPPAVQATNWVQVTGLEGFCCPKLGMALAKIVNSRKSRA